MQYFHHTTTGGSDYKDEYEALDDLTELRTALSEIANCSPEPSLAGIGFPACWEDTFDQSDRHWEMGGHVNFENTNEIYQGALLVRRMLLAYACGDVARTCVYTDFHEPEPLDGTFEKLWSTGLRNDVYADWSSSPWYWAASDADSFLQGTHAWRRPAWYALQRLVWLLHQTASIKLVQGGPESRDVRFLLTANSGLRHPDDADATRGDLIEVWDYATIAWRCTNTEHTDDDAARGEDLEFELELGESGEYLVLSLVPEVRLPENEPVDPALQIGYPDWEDPNWDGYRSDGGGFTTARLMMIYSSNGERRLRVRVECEGPGSYLRPVTDPGPEDNPAPICILTGPRTVLQL